MKPLTRRQLLVRGGLAVGGLVFAGIVLRAGQFLLEAPAPGSKVLTERESEILTSVIEALLPGGTEPDDLPKGDPAFILPKVDVFLSRAERDVRLLFRSMLHVVENQSRIVNFRRFTRRSLEERQRDLRAWESSKSYLEKKAFQSVKLLVGLAYFEQPGALDAVGYYVGCSLPHLQHLSKERLVPA